MHLCTLLLLQTHHYVLLLAPSDRLLHLLRPWGGRGNHAWPWGWPWEETYFRGGCLVVGRRVCWLYLRGRLFLLGLVEGCFFSISLYFFLSFGLLLSFFLLVLSLRLKEFVQFLGIALDVSGLNIANDGCFLGGAVFLHCGNDGVVFDREGHAIGTSHHGFSLEHLFQGSLAE